MTAHDVTENTPVRTCGVRSKGPMVSEYYDNNMTRRLDFLKWIYVYT